LGGRARYAVLARFARCARHVRALGLGAGIRPAGGARLDAGENDWERLPLFLATEREHGARGDAKAATQERAEVGGESG